MRSTKSARVPWRCAEPGQEYKVTLPIYLAFCAIGAALRPWNRQDAKFNVILCPQEDYDFGAFQTAGRILLRSIGDQDRPWVHELSKQWQRDEVLALERDRAVFIKPTDYEMDDGQRIFADAIVDIPRRCRRHAEAALRRFKLPINDRDIELLLTEPWSRLQGAFQPRRSPTLAFERLRRIPQPSAPIVAPLREISGPTLADLHGLSSAVQWGNDLAIDLADYKAGGLPWDAIDSGVMLSGPPGTGKTMFARALANTCDVPITYGSFASWQEKGSLDDVLKAMRAAFDEAAEKAPSILFLDEVDAFGDRTVSDRNQAYMTGVITGLLQLLDGFERRTGVVVLAACNHPDRVDSAIRRAGRLNRHIEIPLPDSEARRAIVRYHSGIELTAGEAEKFDLATEGLAGADLELLVKDARRAARRQRANLSPSHILDHLPRMIELPEDYLRVVAVHEAGHALVAVETGFAAVAKVSVSTHKVVGSLSEIGYVAYAFPPLMRRTRAEHLNEIAVFLGGIAAETEVFGSFDAGSSGPESADLNVVTRLATVLESGLGMGHTMVVEDRRVRRLEQLRDGNPELRQRVHDVIAAEFDRAKALIRNQRAALDKLVEQLMLTKELSGEKVVEIVTRYRKSSVSLAKMPRRMGG